MDVRVGLWRKLSPEELMLLNCVVGEDSWESWTARRSNQSILKDDKSWVFIGRTDVEAETPILWPPHVKSWLIGNDPVAGRDWGQEEKGSTEDEMAGWHHDSMDMSLGKLQELVMDRRPGVLWFMGSQRVGNDWVIELNWTERVLNYEEIILHLQQLQENSPYWGQQYVIHSSEICIVKILVVE